MRTFYSIEEIKKYYNKNTNTYEFIEDGIILDVKFAFDLEIKRSIKARNINALNINALNIDAYDINALNIDAANINALNIDAYDINALNIDAYDIDAYDINAANIDAANINAYDINALNIDAVNINAANISYYAVCFTYQNIECLSIKGRRVNAKHFVLDGEIKIIKKEKENEL